MKILAFVDLHGSVNVLKKIGSTAKKERVDYIVCAGDLTIFGNSLNELLTLLDKIGIPVIIIHGNHEDERIMRKACSKTKNIKFLHKDMLETDGYVFMCYGGGGFSAKDAEFEKWSREAMNKVSEDRKVILITHAPPYGTKLDLILDQPAGSKSIRKFIKLVQPKLAISGHLHENFGVKDRIDKTKIVNPGPWGMVLTV